MEETKRGTAATLSESHIYVTKPPHALPKGFDSFCLLPPPSGHARHGSTRLNGNEPYRYQVMLMNSQLAIARYSVDFSVRAKAKELVRRVRRMRSL